MCTTLKAEAAQQPALAKRLDVMGQMLRQAITQTRSLARGLVPVGDEPDALQIGLAELAERTDALGRVHCRLDSPRPIAIGDAFVAGHLYRIAQEAVNNAVKHARAQHITIRLTRDVAKLVLEVSDDGNGLSKPRTPQPPGLGLGIMRHRARMIGAGLEIASKRGQGTTVRCVLPFTS